MPTKSPVARHIVLLGIANFPAPRTDLLPGPPRAVLLRATQVAVEGHLELFRRRRSIVLATIDTLDRPAAIRLAAKFVQPVNDAIRH